MIPPNPVDFLTDPLSSISRIKRRNLIVSSVVGFLVSKAGIVPQEISALGIKLSLLEQEMLIYLVCATTIYFLVAFIIYGLSDFFIWRKKYQDYREAVEFYSLSWSREDQEAYDNSCIPKIGWLYQNAGLVAYTRAFFEYVVPIIIGVYCAALVFLYAYQS